MTLQLRNCDGDGGPVPLHSLRFPAQLHTLLLGDSRLSEANGAVQPLALPFTLSRLQLPKWSAGAARTWQEVLPAALPPSRYLALDAYARSPLLSLHAIAGRP